MSVSIDTLCYELDETNMTAKVFAPENEIKNVFIPRSVNYQSKEYVITSIDGESFSHNQSIISIEFAKDSEITELNDLNVGNIEKITIPPHVKIITNDNLGDCSKLKELNIPMDSELQTLGVFGSEIETIYVPDNVKEFGVAYNKSLKEIKFSKNSKLSRIPNSFLYKSSLKNFEIPANVSELEDGWNNSSSLIHVSVSPNNKNFLYYDNKMILGKSDKNSKIYDILCFVNRDLKQVSLPSSITKISSYAFAYCSELKSIQIPPDSQLISIGDYAFHRTKISSLFFPSTVSDLQDDWCAGTDYLTNISLSPDNKNFVYLNNQLLLGKTDRKKDKYDMLLFANRDISQAFIPSTVSVISSYAFYKCYDLKLIDFAQGSNLKEIKSYAFRYLPVEKLIIPPSVTKIDLNSFSECKNIQILKFSKDSELQDINSKSFTGSRIEQLIIPMSIFNVIKDCFITASTLEIDDEDILFDDSYHLLESVKQISLPNASNITIEKGNLPLLVIPKDATIQGEAKEDLNVCFLPFNIDSTLMENLLNSKVGELGGGATSIVYKVNNIINGKGFLALKVIKKEICKEKSSSTNVWKEDENDASSTVQYDTEKMENYIKEYKILGVLNHPNIIKAIGFYNGDQTHEPAILLEYCLFNLRDAVHHLEDYELICIVYEICTSMKYIHAQNIIHRDLKLENILINKDKHVKICDFGISAWLDSYTQTTYTHGIGTAIFMAPELFKKKGKYDNKVDVYAFGVVLYYILTKGDFPEGVMGHLNEAEIPSSINELSRNIIQSCWSPSPDDRPSFAEIIEEIEKNDYKLVDGIDDMKIHIENQLKIVDDKGNCLLI